MGETSPNPLRALYPYSRELFDRFVAEFRSFGLRISPQLELHESSGLLVYYDLDQRKIFLNLPDPEDPIGNFQLLLFRPLLACESNVELAEFIRLMLPRLIAHELAHYLRHEYGRFSEDLWQEEQVANILASAVTKTRYTTEERDRFATFLRRALEQLALKTGQATLAVDTYHTPIHALGVSGELTAATIRSLESFDELFGVSVEKLLLESTSSSGELRRRLEQRSDLIQTFNDEYTHGLARYIQLQFGWALIDQESSRYHTLDEFSRDYLGCLPNLLPEIIDPPEVDPAMLLSCYAASERLRDSEPTACRYFYKRYRSLLLRRRWSEREGFTADARALLESRDDEDQESLGLAARLVPQELRKLFPPWVSASASELSQLDFPSDSDRRLWEHVAGGSHDPEAAGSLCRLRSLEASEVYGALPAEILLEVTHSMNVVHYSPGETVVRQGSRNEDLFLISHGSLGLYLEEDFGEHFLGTLEPGEVFGEMAFLTGEPRSASIRAETRAECLVLRAPVVRRLGFTHPVILLQLGRVLARRLRSNIRKQTL